MRHRHSFSLKQGSSWAAVSILYSLLDQSKWAASYPASQAKPCNAAVAAVEAEALTGHLGRDGEPPLVAHPHALHAPVPACTHREAGAGCEYGGERVHPALLAHQAGRHPATQFAGALPPTPPPSHLPLMTSPTPRRKEKVAAPLVWSNTLPLLFSLPTYRITTFFPAFASLASGRPCRQAGRQAVREGAGGGGSGEVAGGWAEGESMLVGLGQVEST